MANLSHTRRGRRDSTRVSGRRLPKGGRVAAYEFRRPEGPGPAPAPRPAKVADPPAWELDVELPDAAGVLRTETLGCTAYTRGEARAVLLRVLNERYRFDPPLDRLPAGTTPRPVPRSAVPLPRVVFSDMVADFAGRTLGPPREVVECYPRRGSHL